MRAFELDAFGIRNMFIGFPKILVLRSQSVTAIAIKINKTEYKHISKVCILIEVRQSEVKQVDLGSLLVENEVARLDVAMDDADRMQHLKTLDLDSEKEEHGRRKEEERKKD
jgi:hypothetical protein